MTTFADISHHQDPVDLAAYKAAGHDRIIMKATEGTGFTDPAFTARWREAGRLGLARVAYHYARARFDGADEFDHFWSTVLDAGWLGPRDRLCLDVEDTEAPSAARAQANCREFGARAAAMGVTRGLVYTGNWYAKPVQQGGRGITASLFPAGWRQLWLSHYDQSVPDGQIIIPAGWTRDQCVARQYTDRARVAGVTGGCDYSRLLREWLPAQPSPTPTEEDDVAKQDVIDALREVFHLPDTGLAVPVGQTHNGQLAVELTSAVQGEWNTLARIEGAIAAVQAETRLQGDDEARILAALSDARSRAGAVLAAGG